jgi:hypothetical protein
LLGDWRIFQPTGYYITFDFETTKELVNENNVISNVKPLSIAAAFHSKKPIKAIYFDLRNGEDFITQWLRQVFKAAKQISYDNKYVKYKNEFTKDGKDREENFPYKHWEVPMLGFNSARFDMNLLLPYLHNTEWEIKDALCSQTNMKCIKCHHKTNGVTLVFKDVMNFISGGTLADFVKDFGNGVVAKGVFAYEVFNSTNYQTVLNQTIPFT